MKVQNMKQEVNVPEGVQASLEGNKLTVKGKHGEVTRDFASPKLKLEVDDNFIIVSAENATKREKTLMGSVKAHITNMVQGSQTGHTYKMKICSGHFPMTVAVSNKEFSVKNFLGEKTPRVLTLKDNVHVKVEGTEVIVLSVSKELAGQTAADIETLTRVKQKDPRIFQDGIYITVKDGKELA
jgi:large subunit ribosomal protein L6